ncbi:hypothetical protein [Paenibacillus chitinolyticus]|uniref:hypothetical protein n=1 Tax=Paenibacillus chitinolyticus TaxID=79263 RepID=UPI0036723097
MIEQDKLQVSLVWFIPIGVIVGKWLLSQLLAAEAAVAGGNRFSGGLELTCN